MFILIPVPGDSAWAGFLGVLHHQLLNLPFRYAAYFHTFYAASFAADDSNSGFGCFQKLRQVFDQCFVRAAFYCRCLQAYLDCTRHLSGDFILAGTRLYSHRKHHGTRSDIFSDLQHEVTYQARWYCTGGVNLKSISWAARLGQ